MAQIMRKFDSKIDEPRTGWDAFGIELATKDGKELYVEGNEVWTQDKKEYIAELRKDGTTMKINKNNITGMMLSNNTTGELLSVYVHEEFPESVDGAVHKFPLSNGFEIHKCNEFLRSLEIKDEFEITFMSYKQYANQLQRLMTLMLIQRLLDAAGSDVAAYEIYNVMLDGFKGQNLVTKAEQENDLHKYVMMALEEFNKCR